MNEESVRISPFRAGGPVVPDHIITDREHVESLLAELSNMAARNSYLHEQVAMQEECTVDAMRARDAAEAAVLPWGVAACVGWLVAIVGFLARC